MYRSGSVCPVVARERPERRPLDDEAVLVERAEQVLDDAAWFRVVVRVKQSYVIPRSRRSSRMSALYRSAASRGERPSLSAVTMTGVPCSSVPDTMRTSLPRRRW